MIFNVVSGGDLRVPVSIRGALEEDILLIRSDGKEYRTKTDKNGHGEETLIIPIGEYTIRGESTNYNGSIIVTKDTSIITAYPKNAIFWHGNGDEEGDSLWNEFGGFVADSQQRPYYEDVGRTANFTFTPKKDSYEISYRWQGTGNDYWIIANAYMKNEISVEGYSNIHISGSMTGGGAWYTTNDLKYEFDVLDSANKTPATLKAGKYLVFSENKYIQPYGSMNNTININAIWLE